MDGLASAAAPLSCSRVEYAKVEEGAGKAGQRERQRAADLKAAELRPKLSQLTLVVPEAVQALAGLEVRRGLTVVEPVQWGVAAPVDLGTHVVVVTATGKRPWEQSIQIEADGVAVSVEVPAPEDEPQAPPPRLSVAPAPIAPPTSPMPPEGDGRAPWGTQRVEGLVVGGLGVVGLGVGAVFGMRATSKREESNADGHCHNGKLCDSVGSRLREEGHTAEAVSAVMFGVGGTALAAGVVLLLTAPRGGGEAGAEVALGPQGIALRGRW